jgi:hypothetical protein
LTGTGSVDLDQIGSNLSDRDQTAWVDRDGVAVGLAKAGGACTAAGGGRTAGVHCQTRGHRAGHVTKFKRLSPSYLLFILFISCLSRLNKR